jgi:hypothetical protein
MGAASQPEKEAFPKPKLRVENPRIVIVNGKTTFQSRITIHGIDY